jgi:hypothetical protein
MSIILRSVKGSELTFAEVDGNFQSLFYSSSVSGDKLNLHFYDNTSQSINLNSVQSDSASYAATASYVLNAQSASYVLNAISSSFASTIASGLNITASNILVTGTASIVFSQIITSSTAFTSGSSLLGANSGDKQTLWGTIDLKSGPLIISGSTTALSSITAPSFTGSLQGTASWANNAITSSYILNAVSSSYAATASYVQNAITASFALNSPAALFASSSLSSSFASSSISASFASTASYVLNAVSSSFASTASFVRNAQTASYVLNAISSSYAAFAQNSFLATTASYTLYASLADAAIYAQNALFATSSLSASFASSSISASYSTNALSASFASSSTSASYATNALSASFANTASYVLNAVSSSQSVSSSYAITSSYSTYAENANTANSATTAGSATLASIATTAVSASYALTASFVQNSISSSFAQNAVTASYVLNAVSASFVNPLTQSLLISGSTTIVGDTTITGSLRVNGSITGSLFGTSSWATRAISASNISGAISNNVNNYILTATGGGNINGEQNLSFEGTTLANEQSGGIIKISDNINSTQPTSGITSFVEYGRLPSNTGEYYGETISGIASSSLSTGQLISLVHTLSLTPHTWGLSDSSNANLLRSIVGICLNNANNPGDPITILLQGFVVTDKITVGGFQIGIPLYMDTSIGGTAGNLNDNMPSNARIMGQYYNDVGSGYYSIRFNPDNFHT